MEQGINEKIVSLDFQNFYTQILTADAQFSYKDGLIVLVTGCLTGNNKVKRKFTQSFFLAPQDKGYFVLNDVFRYVDDETSNDADGSSQTPQLTPSIGMFFHWIFIIVLLILFPHLIMGRILLLLLFIRICIYICVLSAESTGVADESIPIETISLELDSNNGNEVSQVLDNGKEPIAEEGSVVEEQGIDEKKVAAENPADLSQNVTPPGPEVAVPIREDAPKKSFASVVTAWFP